MWCGIRPARPAVAVGRTNGKQTMTEKYELSRRKALAALGTIGAAGAGVGLGTSALYSDTEEFANNEITAGTTNLKVTLGLVDVDSTNPSALQINYDEGESREADGEARTGIQVGDMKPGDCITIRTTVDVEDNPMYVAFNAENVEQDGGETTEPEPTADDGELGENLEFTFGWDSDRSNLHDNSLEGDLEPDPNADGLSGDQFLTNAENGYLYRGRNAEDGNPPGGHGDGSAAPTRIGDDTSADNVDRDQVTHFVEICLPEEVGNEVQGDSVSFDLVWNAEQVRNNPDPGNSGAVDGDVNAAN